MKEQIPIKLQDGTEVKTGMIIYLIDEKYASETGKNKNSFKKYSGQVRCKEVPIEVIHVNRAMNSRSFTVRTKAGCETTYTVKSNCIREKLFGSKQSVINGLVNITKGDINELTRKRNDLLEEVKQIESTIKKLKSAKIKVK